MGKHTAPGFTDHVLEKYRHLPADYSRAQHRNPGPPNEPSLYDLTPEEFTAIKGAGPTY